jgi:alpha-1,2-mannosyltransferase
MAALSHARARNARFSPARRRLALLAIAGITCSIGIVAVVALADAAWMVDIRRNLGAARDLLAGDFGRDGGYLYSPFAALVTVPLTWLPEPVAACTWLAISVSIVAAGVARTTRSLPVADRALVALSVITFVPVVYDLLLGNVTSMLMAAVALAAWRADRPRNGILLGLVVAAAPKPGLIPILVWMLVFRRRALLGAIAAGAVATLACVALVGLDPFLAWARVLRSPDYLSSPMAGNMALGTLPMPWSALLALAAIGLAFVALRKGPWPALVAAICLGLLVSPYTLAYAAGVLLVVVPALAACSPLAAAGFALTASLGVVLGFPVWVASLLCLSVLLPSSWWPKSPPAWVPEDPSETPAVVDFRR